MSTVSTKEAAESLSRVAKTQQEIVAQGAHEYLPFMWWGLFILFGYPPFDYVNGNIWSPIIGLTWIIGMVLTYRYFKDRTARVHTFRQKSLKASIALGVITFVGITVSEVLTSKHYHVWTIVGVLLAVLYIGYGLKLRSESK